MRQSLYAVIVAGTHNLRNKRVNSRGVYFGHRFWLLQNAVFTKRDERMWSDRKSICAKSEYTDRQVEVYLKRKLKWECALPFVQQ